MRIWPVGILVLSMASSASAAWLRVAEGNSGQVWFLDPERMKVVSGKTQAWVKIDHSKDRTVSYRHSMNLFSLDCSAEKYRLLSWVNYDSYGKVVSSKTQPDYGYGVGYEPVIPDTLVEAVQKLVCPAD